MGQEQNILYQSETLEVHQITERVFVHISFLVVQPYGKVACNGMVFIRKGEALIFDSPANEAATNELISWIEESQKSTIKGVVATHFHIDCLGGLDIFHAQKIPSYAHTKTIDLAKAKQEVVPQIGFEEDYVLKIGGKKVTTLFFGEGHTVDNVVGYIRSEKALFGGCLIKSMGAGKGNLADANVEAWSNTVRKIKKKYPKLQHVVPGHGKTGGIELLDYTIDKFADQ